MAVELPNIYLIAYQFGHHSKSGYSRLIDYVPCKTIRIPSAISTISKLVGGGIIRERLSHRTGLPGYDPASRWLEFVASRIVAKRDPSLLHFIYPENSFFFTAQSKRSSRCKIVGTYHQPVAELKRNVLITEPLKHLDAVILLSDSQREFFESFIEQERIFVVPHGVDCSFFTPPISVQRERRIIAVGNWLRDFDTLVDVLKILGKSMPEVRCDVVSLPQNRQRFNGLKNVDFHTGISDEELRRLYWQASVSVLVLKDAAATNALLESMACGVPIVATDLPAIREYTRSEGCSYVPAKNGMMMAEVITALMNDETRMTAMGKFNGEHAQGFSWETVALQTNHVYTSVTTA